MATLRIGYLKKAWQEKFNLKRSWPVVAYRVTTADGIDSFQPWAKTKSEAREVAVSLGIVLIESGDLTMPQLEALQRFARRYGSKWKATLLNLWALGADDRVVRDGALLRQVRNNLGPEALRKLRLPAEFYVS